MPRSHEWGFSALVLAGDAELRGLLETFYLLEVGWLILVFSELVVMQTKQLPSLLSLQA